MRSSIAILCCFALHHQTARAQVAADTFGPGGSFSSTWMYRYGRGPSAPDRLGFGFAAQASGPLKDISAPIYRIGPGSLVFELYADSVSLPGTPGALLFSTLFPVPTTSIPPVVTTLTLFVGPQLTAGVTYYAVFTPQVAGTEASWFLAVDPFSGPHGPEVYRFGNGPWQAESQAYAAFKLTVQGDLCYANCDASITVPILNINDFTCFLNSFAAGSSYANCDVTTAPPMLNVNDFTCFLNKFAAGCP